MINRTMLFTTALFALLFASPVLAQQSGTTGDEGRDTAEKSAPEEVARERLVRETSIQRIRPQDQRGLHVFEAPKEKERDFQGVGLELGASFAQQFQALDHKNEASAQVVGGINANELIDLGAGFNLAAANLNLNVQLAPGIRVALTTYLSSRHHPEAWVKDGYLLIDESPLAVPALEQLMEYVTLKAGHFEINYGDAHFRRTDNGNALYNPFVGNYIMDGFTTEIGGEVYLRANGWLAMAGVTGGELNGSVVQPEERAPSFIGKIGYDQQLSPELRVRLTGSAYTTKKSISNSLYGGDRTGSRYFLVLENTEASVDGQFTSGRINPGLRNNVTAFMVNPFVKYGGAEFFGTIERATGASVGEPEDRTWNQYAADVLYRFMDDEQLYVGARYNLVDGELQGTLHDVSIDRVQIGAGWFVTPTVLLKAEYVTQTYKDFPTQDIRHGGSFDGVMVEGVVSF